MDIERMTDFTAQVQNPPYHFEEIDDEALWQCSYGCYDGYDQRWLHAWYALSIAVPWMLLAEAEAHNAGYDFFEV